MAHPVPESGRKYPKRLLDEPQERLGIPEQVISLPGTDRPGQSRLCSRTLRRARGKERRPLGESGRHPR